MSGFRRPPSDVERMTSLRVGNLPFRAHSDDLLPLFEKYGDVGDVYIPLERGSGRSRGFAFVRYYDKRDAEDAMDALNGRTYDGRDLRITIDAGRPSGGKFRGGDRDRDYRRRSRSRSYDRRRSRSDSRDRRRDRSRSRDRGDRGDRRSRDRSDSRDRKSSRRDRSSSNDRGRSGSKSRSRSR